MVWNHSRLQLSKITASILVSLIGWVMGGSASLAIAHPSQLSPSSPRATQDRGSMATTTSAVPLTEGMAYREARQRLLRQGWQPNLQGDPPNLQSTAVRELFDLGYREIKDCAGTGEGPCRFEFINQAGQLLVVVATTGGSVNTNRFVRRWWLEKNPNSVQASASAKIASGFYSLGGTDQGLEVRGQRYRYFDELGNQPWRSISELKSITRGVVFDGERYWCLSTLAPRNRPAACSANGWNQEVLPFVGTRFFNFLGGSGTGQSITINSEGYTIVKLHGTANTGLLYQGEYTNPIILNDGFGLLIKGNKIYQLKADGQMARGCRQEGSPCEATLYQR